MYGPMIGPMLGAELVLQDIWNADQAALLIQDEAVTYMMVSTLFLADLTDLPWSITPTCPRCAPSSRPGHLS